MTPTQQFIANLRECETTMTKGRYAVLNGRLFIGRVTINADDTATVEGDPHNNALAEGWPAIMRGIATLKNANPTVIAMLERAIGALGELAQDEDDVHLAVSKNMAAKALDEINALAAKGSQ